MIRKNIDIVAVTLLLLAAAVFSNVQHALIALPLHDVKIYRNWNVPRALAPLPPEPPRLPSFVLE